jgi:DNA-binding transcriptional MerR regulator
MNDFNIQAASLMSGVSVHQIRAWEKRYNAVEPKRLGNNFRSYSQENIQRLKLLGELTRHGIAISKIAPLETKDLQEQVDSLALDKLQIVKTEVYPDTKEKLELLMNFLKVKRYDLVKHEIMKFKTLMSVTGIMVPILKVMMQSPSSFESLESRGLLSALVNEIERISITAQGR